jgi:DnaJ-domain-containing protein 1
MQMKESGKECWERERPEKERTWAWEQLHPAIRRSWELRVETRELLKKYSGDEGRPKESTRGENSSTASAHSGCAKCGASFARLNIPIGATPQAIRQKYRDLCNVWHPDRWEHNERLRNETTKEFQEIQQAYEHINSHFSGKS